MEAGRLGVGEFAFPGPLRDQLPGTVDDDTLAVAHEFRVVGGEGRLDLAALLRQASAEAVAR